MSKTAQPDNSINQAQPLAGLPKIEREPRFRVRVKSIDQSTKGIIVLSLERPDQFLFESGQYIWLVLPEISKHRGVVDRRAYTIVSNADSSTIDLLIRVTGSQFMPKIKALKPGQAVDIIGPMGIAFKVPPEGAIIITSVAGLSPFLSVLRSKTKKEVSLMIYDPDKSLLETSKKYDEWSARYNHEIVAKHRNPRQADFVDIVKTNDKRAVFVAGAQGFTKSVVKILLSLGLAPERLRHDYEEVHSPGKIDEQLADMFDDVTGGQKKLLRKKKIPDIGSFFLQVTEQNRDHTILADRNGRIIFANQAAKDATGYSFDEMRGQTPRLWGGLMPRAFYKHLWTSLQNGMAIKDTIINRRRDGSLYVAIATITPIMLGGKVVAFVATEENITSLYELDKTKSEFVSIASHQLRTPLSTVNWYTEMLLSGGAGKLTTKQQQYLQEIYGASQHMVELVDSLLNVSRLELGTFVSKPEAADWAEIIQSEISEQKINADEKKIKLTFSHPKNLPTMRADPKNLRIIIQNLLSNAIKYSPIGGKVSIKLSVHGKKQLLLEVADTGYGIPKNQQGNIFTKMFRADNVRQKNIEGTGLGLYIVKSIVERASGQVWFESRESQGTAFYIKIPIRVIYKIKEVNI